MDQNKTESHLYLHGLAPRVDALETALIDLASSNDSPLETLRELATAIESGALTHDLGELSARAHRVRETTVEEARNDVRKLIATMRAAMAAAQEASVCVLLVGDDDTFMSHLDEHIQTPEIKTLRSPTPADALSVVEQHPLDLLVLHAKLPDDHSAALVRQIRQSPRTAQIEILVINTGGALKRRDSMELDVNAFMQRSDDIEDVASWITDRIPDSQQARGDGPHALTGLMTRDVLETTFTRMAAFAKDAGEPAAVALVEIDDYRQIGLHYGAKTTGQALAQLGVLLQKRIRSTDICASWGEFRFVFLFPGETDASGAIAAKKIVQAVADTEFKTTDDTTFRLTASGGVAAMNPDRSLEENVGRADRQLFKAKERGGGQVAASDVSPTSLVRHALLVQKNTLLSQVVRHLFEKEGCRITQADSVAAALASTRSTDRYQIAIIDEDVAPSGFDVLEDFRREPRRNRTPVVMLLSSETNEKGLKALSMGANDYLARPFSPFTFMERIRRLISRGEQENGSADRPYRLLAIDARPDDLVILASSLQRAGGYIVSLETDIAKLVIRLSHEQPEIILVPMHALGVKESPLTEALATAAEHESVKIVVSLERDEGEDIIQYSPFPVAGVLRKPFPALDLTDTLEKMLAIKWKGERPTVPPERMNREVTRLLQAR